MTKPNPDLSPLLPDDATVKARRAALVDAVSPGGRGPRPVTPWRRRGPRLALGGAMALAAVAVALIAGAGGDNTSKAFAVEPQDGGGVTIKIYSLEDAAGLEAALEEAGIEAQVTWLAAGTVCREPHYKESLVHLPGGGTFGGVTMGGPGGPITIGVGSTQSRRESFGKRGEVSQDEMRDSVPNLNLDPAAFRPGQSVVLSGTPIPHDGDPEGGSIAKLGVAEGPVEPCEPVPALPSGSGFGAGGGPGYSPRGDDALGQAAIAADLRQAANSAEAADGAVEAPLGSGQFLYVKTEEVHLEAWDPDGPASGPKTHPRYFTDRQLNSGGNAMPALVPTLKEVWTASDGTTREREALGRVDFLSGADQRRWEEAGSPPPFAYNPTEHDVGRDGSGRPLKAYSSKAFRGRREFAYLSRLSRLPTESEALRLDIENRRGGAAPVNPSPADSPRGGATVERLLEILSEPIASPALRAAAFKALAEIPGIGLERDVTDAAGREGDAISWVRDRGFGSRFIFDPRTSQILSEAEVIFNAQAVGYPGVPDGTVFRETAYLQTGIVDSTRERP
ncbi:MAG TPA: hypothetical protein VEW07_06445 [Solirubrobacterales bacterium]|nr:hypothetical protein [Solirubrobacterales bacterium]